MKSYKNEVCCKTTLRTKLRGRECLFPDKKDCNEMTTVNCASTICLPVFSLHDHHRAYCRHLLPGVQPTPGSAHHAALVFAQ
ncbi:hypothetical protein PFISCL1PPCAC_23426 [Pristionchus fissidentatus]|uniref:Uncharacterized protein n=1 Tax=Pristionchus fissidentatus TaxID=1538716 RepID=A0AAV5WN24_9BILA|nr:hypothetical protein PFISCL1PPCAC_23426 [Pristionchus fissidentatus]